MQASTRQHPDPLGCTAAEYVTASVESRSVGKGSARTAYRRFHREGLAPAGDPPGVHPIGRREIEGETIKFTLTLPGDLETESVLIPMRRRDGSVTRTLCVSSQIGCAMGCRFCETAQMGLLRNLETSDIVAQWHAATHQVGHRPKNIVFMGMGEPLSNYDTLVRTIRILNAEWGLNFGARRITVSTSGLAPQILKLAEEGIAVRLAISLHGATNEVRQQIMPINKKYPLEELIPAARAFQQRHGRMLTLEFILIEDVNDSLEQALELAKIARDLHAHVNCIPYNTVEGLQWKRPSLRRQDAFVDVLRKARVSATIRREKGHDINAACGQLRLKTEKELADV